MKYIFPIRRNSSCKAISGPNRQQGSMLYISVFVIVVMGMLGLTLTNILATSAESVAYEVLGLRALNSAKTGLEVVISDTFPLQTSSSSSNCGSTGDVSLNGISGLNGCQYNAECQADSSLGAITYYRFSSTGQCSVSGVVVSRTVAVDARTL